MPRPTPHAPPRGATATTGPARYGRGGVDPELAHELRHIARLSALVFASALVMSGLAALGNGQHVLVLDAHGPRLVETKHRNLICGIDEVDHAWVVLNLGSLSKSLSLASSPFTYQGFIYEWRFRTCASIERVNEITF
jgi:hypothetical protein